MNVYIEDSAKDICIKDITLSLNEILNIFSHLSEDEYSEVRMFTSDVSKYKMKINFWGAYGWRIDYPIQLRYVHKQCYATKEQCIAIIKELYEKGNIDQIPGFIEVPIQHFTLDDMLEFKKEDEMTLRGQDPFI